MIFLKHVNEIVNSNYSYLKLPFTYITASQHIPRLSLLIVRSDVQDCNVIVYVVKFLILENNGIK